MREIGSRENPQSIFWAIGVSDTIDNPLLESPGGIAEFQGLYGAFHVSEVLLQKIWLRQQFAARNARTTDGEAVVVRSPGRWNRLSGPDFHDARLQIGGRAVAGAVEVHFHAEAWAQHHHDRDRAYDDVVLHVVLFPPDQGRKPASTSAGRTIPTLVLIDLLWQDLEAYAEDEAVAALAGRDPLPLLEGLLAMEEAPRRAAIVASMERRWREKTRFARLRIERLGWTGACHHTALEILGYRQNRAPMARVASRFGWDAWRAGRVTIDEALATAAEVWTTRGVRPANHPRRRLEQYADWAARVPDWPERLAALVLRELPENGIVPPTGERKANGTKELRARLVRELFGEAIGGTRVDTLIIDLVLPCLGATGPREAAWTHWRIWYPGDMPDALRTVARQLAAPRAGGGLTNGLLQALFGLVLQALQRETTPP